MKKKHRDNSYSLNSTGLYITPAMKKWLVKKASETNDSVSRIIRDLLQNVMQFESPLLYSEHLEQLPLKWSNRREKVKR